MAERFVVVPWTPGPLIVPTSDERTRDEVDELVDELFGPDVDEKPGWFDAGLVAAGVALFVVSEFERLDGRRLSNGVMYLRSRSPDPRNHPSDQNASHYHAMSGGQRGDDRLVGTGTPAPRRP
jgi:hypothetical protein